LQSSVTCESSHITEVRSNIDVNEVQPILQDLNQQPIRRKKPTNTADDCFMDIADNSNTWLTICHQNIRGLSDESD
jgi:hypothetical protein